MMLSFLNFVDLDAVVMKSSAVFPLYITLFILPYFKALLFLSSFHYMIGSIRLAYSVVECKLLRKTELLVSKSWVAWFV